MTYVPFSYAGIVIRTSKSRLHVSHPNDPVTDETHLNLIVLSYSLLYNYYAAVVEL